MLDAAGEPVTERVRVETPRPATPRRVLQALWALVEPLGTFERVSVGFPGVVVEGVTRTAPNLHPDWAGFPLARTLQDRFRRPTRVLNDAGLQGYGVVEGQGVEMLLTLGTGMGCALFNDGVYVPNLELAHHPFRKKKTYEDYVGGARPRRGGEEALEPPGRAGWWRRCCPSSTRAGSTSGGGNAKHLDVELPPEVHLVANIAGLLGGIALWRGHDGA